MSAPKMRRKRRSPRRPAPTIREFAIEAGTTEPIMRGLVGSGLIHSVNCNGVRLIPPRGQEQYFKLFGQPPRARPEAQTDTEVQTEL